MEGFLELELMLCSSTFNDPERFEVERKRFADNGLVTEESYHRAALIAHLANLNNVEASIHSKNIRQYPHLLNPKTGMLVVHKEELYFLNWIGAVKPSFLPPPDSMLEKRAEEVSSRYEREKWHRKIDKPLKNLFGLDKAISIDAWSLYQLTEKNVLDTLEGLDSVYVSHMSIIRLLEELSRTDNPKIRILLDYLKVCNKIDICSAGFKAQLEVRNVAPYSESASAVAVAVEKDCLMVYGEPDVDEQLVEHFGKRIIRVNEMRKLLE